MPHIAPAAVWNDEQALKDMTKFEPLADVKVIMITGGAGFIGSWIARNMTLLYSDCYHIVCFDSLDTCSSLNNLRILGECPNFSFVKGDINSPRDVAKCLRNYKVDVIMNFAALSHVDTSFDAPYEFCSTNFTGTLVLLEAARSQGIKRFIHVSTDEVYGEVLPGSSDHVESSPLKPTNPYSASKAAAEMMLCAYAKSFHIPTIIVRSNNVYGPNQFPEKVIPKFTALMLRGEKVPLYGSGENTRRYVYAGDVANAFNTILHRGSVGEIYNIGTYDEISNRDLSSILLRLTQPSSIKRCGEEEVEAWFEPTVDRPFHDRRYGVDFSKLKELGWRQKVALEEGLRRTVNWYRGFGESWWGDIDDVLMPGVRDASANGTASDSNGHR